jgi:Fe-S-cluster containining protein
MVKPSEVYAKAQRLEEQNYKFRAFLKNRADYDELDAQFLELHKELFEGYDCCKCANCCKSYSIILASDDVKRIAAFLEISENDFISEYLTDADADEEKPYRFKTKPCSFLNDDGRCRIQECKPDVCREYPHTEQPDRMASLLGVVANAEVCPIVFEILERLKKMYRFRNK